MDPLIYGEMLDNSPVYQINLQNNYLHVSLITYGCALTAIEVPDRSGEFRDILLGYPSLSLYQKQSSFMGALIGRYANRIADSSFDLNGIHYSLPANDGINHLHGGPYGFDKQNFKIDSVSDTEVTLFRFSLDGEEGYPGNLMLKATYTLSDTDLTVSFSATSDQDTIHSFTLHPYFNLSGQNTGSILEQYLQIYADSYTPVRFGCIPTGEICPVADTPLDFRDPYKIGQRINASCEQLALVSGYDHNYILRDGGDELKKAAVAWSEESGIELKVYTTMPGLQFYSGNFIDSETIGKNGVPYEKRTGFCLEPQQFPDSPHHPYFPSTVLKAGVPSLDVIRYSFGIHSDSK